MSPRFAKRAIEATKQHHFLDKRSFEALDGSLRIYGKDWEAHRIALFERDGWRCQVKRGGIYPWICHNEVTVETGQVHHVVPRSKAGTDDFSNLITSCANCHAREHHARNPRWGESRKQATADEFTETQMEE